MQYLILFFSLINLMLGFIILIHSKHEKENTTFLAFAFFASLWTFNNFYLRLNPEVTTLRISYALGIIVATFAMVWLFFFLKKPLPRILKFGIIPLSLCFFFGTIFTENVIKSLYSIEYLGYDGELGKLFYIYSTYFSVIIISIIYVCFKSFKAEKNLNRKNQIKYVLAGVIFFAFTSSVVSFFIPTFLHTLRYTILDNFSFSIFLTCIVYAIVRFQLFSVKVIVTEIFVFSLWVIILIRTIIADSLKEQLINGGLLFVMILFGILLIRSVLREVKTREKIERLAKDLEKANDRLKELDQLKSEFVSLATHQIRGPLTAIKGYASLIIEGDYGVVPNTMKDALDKIFQSSQSLAVLVEDYLNVTRIEQGRMKYDLTDFDFAKLVNEVVSELKPVTEKKGLAIHVETPEKAVIIHADIGKIKQVIGNLIDNSVKYTPEGNIEIQLTENTASKKMLLSIKDTGVGIAPHTIPHLFQKFSRAEDAAKTNILGTGLGLYVAKQVIEAHKGRVWAESEGQGKGSQFYVELATL